MFNFNFVLLFLLFFSHLSASGEIERNPYVDPAIWEQVSPYFLPADSSVKKKLDAIFSSSRALFNLQSLKDAGFTKIIHRPCSHAYVMTHPKLKGYVIKLFTDQQQFVDWEAWVHRIHGAQCIRNAIKRHGYQHHFKVPKKWIYPLPAEPSPPPDSQRKNFILVAKEMKLLEKRDNRAMWKSPVMSPDRIKAMYTIIKEEGLADSINVTNLPFLKDGRQAFIDTEWHHRWPVEYNKLTRRFSRPMRQYWMGLVANTNPKAKPYIPL